MNHAERSYLSNRSPDPSLVTIDVIENRAATRQKRRSKAGRARIAPFRALLRTSGRLG